MCLAGSCKDRQVSVSTIKNQSWWQLATGSKAFAMAEEAPRMCGAGAGLKATRIKTKDDRLFDCLDVWDQILANRLSDLGQHEWPKQRRQKCNCGLDLAACGACGRGWAQTQAQAETVAAWSLSVPLLQSMASIFCMEACQARHTRCCDRPAVSIALLQSTHMP